MYDIMVRFVHDFEMKSRLGRLQLVGAVVGALHAVATAQLLQQVTVGDGRVRRATQRHQLRDRHAERPAETQSVTSDTVGDWVEHTKWSSETDKFGIS